MRLASKCLVEFNLSSAQRFCGALESVVYLSLGSRLERVGMCVYFH